MISKRSYRRNRYKIKSYLRYLDSVILQESNNNFSFAANTWSATRCPDCGLKVRPALLGYFEGVMYEDETYSKFAGHIHGCDRACDSIYFKSKCPGINDNWMDDYVTKNWDKL
jgi:hypothetical protein